MSDLQKRLATCAEVAAYFNVPTATLTMWAHKGTGPQYRIIGRHARYRWADVEAWEAKQVRGVPA
jgi:excisionase family DNA binding protein